MKDKTLSSLNFVLGTSLVISFFLLVITIYDKHLTYEILNSIKSHILKGELNYIYIFILLSILIYKYITPSINFTLNIFLAFLIPLFYFLHLNKVFLSKEYYEAKEELELYMKYLNKDEILEISYIKKLFYYNVLLFASIYVIYNFSFMNLVAYLMLFIYILSLIFDENMKINIVSIDNKEL